MAMRFSSISEGHAIRRYTSIIERELAIEPVRPLGGDLYLIAGQVHLDADRQKFSPHATLARLKKKRRFSPDVAAEIAQQSQRQFGSFDVSEIVIFESILERSGPRYQPLSRVKLQGPSGKPD